jgi:hypothetical protein
MCGRAEQHDQPEIVGNACCAAAENSVNAVRTASGS